MYAVKAPFVGKKLLLITDIIILLGVTVQNNWF